MGLVPEAKGKLKLLSYGDAGYVNEMHRRR